MPERIHSLRQVLQLDLKTKRVIKRGISLLMVQFTTQAHSSLADWQSFFQSQLLQSAEKEDSLTGEDKTVPLVTRDVLLQHVAQRVNTKTHCALGDSKFPCKIIEGCHAGYYTWDWPRGKMRALSLHSARKEALSGNPTVVCRLEIQIVLCLACLAFFA